MHVERSISVARRSWSLSLKYVAIESEEAKAMSDMYRSARTCSIYSMPRTWRNPTLPLALCAVSMWLQILTEAADVSRSSGRVHDRN